MSQQFILCSSRLGLRVCTAASLATGVISGEIDVLAGSVTPLFTPPNQKLSNVSATDRAEHRKPLYQISYLMEDQRENTQNINICPGIPGCVSGLLTLSDAMANSKPRVLYHYSWKL